MLKKIGHVFFLILSLVCFNAYAEENSLTVDLQNIHSMVANFSQATFNKSSKMIRKATGTMALQRPGKFRWEITQPMEQLIIANGKRLSIYDKDLEQLTIRSLKNATGETPALLLSDTSLSFDKEFFIKSLASHEGTHWYLLTPKDKGSLFATIKIGFHDQALSEMELKDHMGQTTRIQFSQIKTNIALAEALFNLKVPKNVDVIDETKR